MLVLDHEFRVIRNPWSHAIPDHELVEIIYNVTLARAKHVAKHFEEGRYKRNSLGIAILDPTAPISLPSKDTLLAVIMIGPEGRQFLPNAIAKAIYHRDHGRPAGYGRYVDLTQLADGDFTYGYSTQVDDTIAGASGQSELQDACEAGHAVVSFNYWVREECAKWLEEHPDSRWFCNQDLPGALYAELAESAIREGT